jgi:hypothetical protein
MNAPAEAVGFSAGAGLVSNLLVVYHAGAVRSGLEYDAADAATAVRSFFECWTN